MALATKPLRLIYNGKFERVAEKLAPLVRREMTGLAREMRDWIKEGTAEDSGESKRRTEYEINGQNERIKLIVIGRAPQAIYSQQFGRRPGGKQPPPALLLLWVQRKGLSGTDTASRKSAAARVGKTKRLKRNTKANISILKRRQIAAERKVRRMPTSPRLRQEKAIAFLIGRAIKRRGSPEKYLPYLGARLFSRVLFVKRGRINHTQANIARGIVAAFKAA